METVVCVLKACTCSSKNSDSKAFANSGHFKSFFVICYGALSWTAQCRRYYWISMQWERACFIYSSMWASIPTEANLATCGSSVYVCKITHKKNFSLPTYPNLFGPVTRTTSNFVDVMAWGPGDRLVIFFSHPSEDGATACNSRPVFSRTYWSLVYTLAHAFLVTARARMAWCGRPVHCLEYS